jgi:hypothetical protein
MPYVAGILEARMAACITFNTAVLMFSRSVEFERGILGCLFHSSHLQNQSEVHAVYQDLMQTYYGSVMYVAPEVLSFNRV